MLNYREDPILWHNPITSRPAATAPKSEQPVAEKLIKVSEMTDKKVVCVPKRGTCSPQCPSVIWDKTDQKLVFGWVDDLQGCLDGLFEPDATVMFLYTFAEYESPTKQAQGFHKSIVFTHP